MSELECPNCQGEGYTVEPVCCGHYNRDSDGNPSSCCGIPDPEQVQCNCYEHIENMKKEESE